jgi:hypothetical protein
LCLEIAQEIGEADEIAQALSTPIVEESIEELESELAALEADERKEKAEETRTRQQAPAPQTTDMQSEVERHSKEQHEDQLVETLAKLSVTDSIPSPTANKSTVGTNTPTAVTPLKAEKQRPVALQ